MTFEEIFKIPEDHTLKQMSFRQKGSLAQDEFWEHEQFDSNGMVVAKYSSWHCTDAYGGGKTRAGYKKYSPDGVLIEESDELPL